jgi:predicted HTH transcriptional regulator
MITAEDILLLTSSGEGYNSEFKLAVPSKVRDLTEEVCAFANAAGGILLMGVNDHNEITGIRMDNVKRSAIQNSIGEISPPLHCSLSFKGTVEKTVEKTVENIIKNLILENPKITTKNMIKATGLTRRGVEYHLNKLKDSGKIERVGSDRGGYWKVIEINNEQ